MGKLMLRNATQPAKVGEGKARFMASGVITKSKIERMHFRLPQDVKARVEKAAIASGQTLTDFAVNVLAGTRPIPPSLPVRIRRAVVLRPRQRPLRGVNPGAARASTGKPRTLPARSG